MGAEATSRLIPVSDVSAEDEASWRDLAAAAIEPNPFFEPEFVIPAERFLSDASGVALAVCERDGEWSSCLPLHIGRWRGPLRAAMALRTRYSFLGTPLVRPGDEAARIGELLAAARKLTGERRLAIERFHSGGRFGEALAPAIEAAGLIEVVSVTAERAVLRRREDGDYLSHFRSRRRREMRRASRKLAEAIDQEPEIVDLSADPDVAEIFLALEGSGWKGREGTAMISEDADAAFFAELCANYRTDGRLEVLCLRAVDDVIAMLVDLQSGNASFSVKMTYDESYSEFGPGSQLALGNLDHFHASGMAYMDSCAEPDNEMMNRLWPERMQLQSIALVPIGPRGRLEQRILGYLAEKRREKREKRWQAQRKSDT